MPCYDPRDEPSHEQHSRDLDEQAKRLRKEFRHNSDVAELLCYVLGYSTPTLVNSSPALAAWWREHKARDAAIKKRQIENRHRKHSDKL